MKNNGGASFSLQRRLQPAVFAANVGLFFNGAVLNRGCFLPDKSPSDHTTHVCPLILTSLTRSPVTF